MYRPEHKFAQQEGYVPEHRIVIEEYYKCCLLPWAFVHHINERRDDNRIENLKVVSKGGHLIIHHFENRHRSDFGNRICTDCRSNTTYCNPKRWKKGSWSSTEEWYKNPLTGWRCKSCHVKFKKRMQKHDMKLEVFN